MNNERKTMLVDLQNILNKVVLRDCLQVLEAGCGSRSHIELPASAVIAGIDISEKQLKRNIGLAIKIHGDIQTHDLGTELYDLIICWDVLEHVENPILALKNFFRAVRPKGFILLAFPNVLSLWGLATKFTPHWVHVYFYRKIFGNTNAGLEDNGPFPTYLDWRIAPTSLGSFFKEQGMEICFQRFYDPMLHSLKKRRPWVAALYSFLSRVLFIISISKIGGDSNSGFVVLLRKD